MSGRLRQAALLFAVLSIFTLSGQSSDPAILKEAGWKPLLDGRSTAGWQAENPAKGSWVATKTVAWNPDVNPRELVASGGRGALIANGPKGGVTNLVTGRTFGDIELYAEFLLAQKSNSGVYLHGLYEVQVFDSFGVEKPKSSDCGGIYERWIDNRGVGGAAPRVNASRPPGDWQSFHIWFQAPRFDGVGKKSSNAKFLRVLHNGKLVQENIDVEGPTRSGLDLPEAPLNPLMLQGDHGPVAFRNIYFRELRKP